jgi:hypothetical protein
VGYSQSTNIAIAIAQRDKCGGLNREDVGFAWYYGTDDRTTLAKKARADVNASFSNISNVFTEANYGGGSCVIVISATITNSEGCQKQVYGCGFGETRTGALQAAKKSLYGRAWTWNENDPFSILLDECR